MSALCTEQTSTPSMLDSCGNASPDRDSPPRPTTPQASKHDSLVVDSSAQIDPSQHASEDVLEGQMREPGATLEAGLNIGLDGVKQIRSCPDAASDQVQMNISPKASNQEVEVAAATIEGSGSIEVNGQESDNDVVTFIPSGEDLDREGQESAGRDAEPLGDVDYEGVDAERSDGHFTEETDLLLAMMLQEEELALHRRMRSFNKPIFAGVHSHEELPVYTIQDNQIVNFEENPECLICLCEYEVGQEVKILPCLHQFHSNCASKWLSESHYCPVCKISIRTGKTQEHRTVPSSRQSRNVQMMANHHERASRTSDRFGAEASRERYSTRIPNPRSSTGRNTLNLGNRSLHSTPVRRYLRSPMEGAASSSAASNSSPAQTSRGFMKERFLQLKKFFGR
uniref:RING-type domain-containing protein n=1 Tax=Hanusia phi TaxID=3032 RepID=A0A7S0I0P7_9CRYP|mmetsp:Transcript_7448/g.16968  ORF Transcript_7448/g.16968 Transcript_7448/m.16968 type:complete len:397 (+) Transcript_7448:143-1333(+)